MTTYHCFFCDNLFKADSDTRPACPGCGVSMHSIDKCLPGHEPPVVAIPVDALTRQQQCIAPPITVKFQQNDLTEDQVQQMCDDLQRDMEQALLKLLEDNGGKIPYNDETQAHAQRIFEDAYKRVCEKYNIVTISVVVEL